MRRLALLVLPLALGACSVFGPGEAEVDLTVTLWPEGARALDFAVEVGERRLGRDAFRDVDGRQFDGGPLAAAARQTDVTCTVTDGAASSAGTLRLDLEDDWEYGVSCIVGTAEQAAGCFGCRGSRSFALDPALGLAPTDSLFLVWGGDHRDSDVVY